MLNSESDVGRLCAGNRRLNSLISLSGSHGFDLGLQSFTKNINASVDHPMAAIRTSCQHLMEIGI